MVECVLLNVFFHNFSFRQNKKTNEFYRFDIWNWKCRSRSWRRKMELTPFDRKRLSVYCWFFHNFSCLAKWISHILNIWNRKRRSRWQVQFLHWRVSMANVKICKRYFVTFFYFHYSSNVTDTYTETHVHTETDKPVAIDEILQICLSI